MALRFSISGPLCVWHKVKLPSLFVRPLIWNFSLLPGDNAFIAESEIP